MFWFTPKCPINSEDKDWLEDSFLWLVEEFGAESLRKTQMILPNEDFFPDDFTGDVSYLKKTLRRVSGFMGVDYEKIEISLFTDEKPPMLHPLATSDSKGSGTCGLYQKLRSRHLISIEENLLSNPTNLIATIAHELAHARLIGENRLSPDCEDQELLTDLTTIFFGLGIFTANSLFRFEQFTNAQYHGWQTSRQGYIDEEMAGYFLALFAFAKSETNPVWMQFLDTNVKHYFKKSLKFLEKTGDTKLKDLAEIN